MSAPDDPHIGTSRGKKEKDMNLRFTLLGTGMLFLCVLGIACRRSRTLLKIETKSQTEGIDEIATVEQHGNRFVFRFEQSGREVLTANLGESFSLGHVEVLCDTYSRYLVANDGVILGGVNYQTGVCWGANDYGGLPYLRLNDAMAGGFIPLASRDWKRKGSLPDGHPLADKAQSH